VTIAPYDGASDVPLAGVWTATQAHPETCAEAWWGKRLAAVRVRLAAADEPLLLDLLTDAWERRAPKRLAP